MYHRAFLTVSAVLISACTDPSEPQAEGLISEVPTEVAAAARPVETAMPTAVSAPRREPAPPGAAMEDALIRLLPALEDQSIAKELRPLMQEAHRMAGNNAPDAAKRALNRLGARVQEIGQIDPDLAAVTLALEASR